MNSSAYFTALNPAHQIFTGAVQAMFCIQKLIYVSTFHETVSWLIVQSTAWPFIYSLVNTSSRGYKTTYMRLTWGTACSISWLCPSISNMVSHFLYFHDLFLTIKEYTTQPNGAPVGTKDAKNRRNSLFWTKTFFQHFRAFFCPAPSGTEKRWVYAWCMKMGVAYFSEIVEGSSSVTRCHNPANIEHLGCHYSHLCGSHSILGLAPHTSANCILKIK